MQMRTLTPLFFALSVALVGCNGGGNKTSQTQTGPTDGLKELIKEDVEIGKPSRFAPKGKPVERGDSVWVVYTGTLKNGTQFDTNDPAKKEGARPFSFQVGAGMVIKGWEDGLIGMYPGGVRKLSVPWKDAYGERGKGDIPPFTDLYFTVKLLELQKEKDEMTYGMIEEKVGAGPVAKIGSTVSVHYTAHEVGGALLQDTRDKESYGKPVVFKIGNEECLAAIEDGIIGMKPGGIRELALPPRIGFHPNEQTGIKDNSFFYVRIELLTVK